MVILRPTMRLAYWIGMRRCPWSMNTTATMMPSPISMITENLNAPPCRRIALPSPGNDAMTLVKIRIDMPLPTPRWVMSSPSHMIMAVPAVSVSTISAMFGGVNVSAGKGSGSPVCPEWNRNTMPVDCSTASTTVT